MGFVADVAGLRSSVDAAAWRGVNQAVSEAVCAAADLALPTRPSEYRRVLQSYAGHNLVIAGSFGTADAVHIDADLKGADCNLVAFTGRVTLTKQ